jgi:hypothetical protein
MLEDAQPGQEDEFDMEEARNAYAAERPPRVRVSPNGFEHQIRIIFMSTLWV